MRTRSYFKGGVVQIFAPGRVEVKNCPERGIKIIFRGGGGRVGESHEYDAEIAIKDRQNGFLTF